MTSANQHFRALRILFEQQSCWMIDPLAQRLPQPLRRVG